MKWRAEWSGGADDERQLKNIKMFLNEKGACQSDMKTVSLQLYGFS